MAQRKKIVLVGMSGGVDSSVATALFKAEGYEVIGVMMKIWDGRSLPPEKSSHSCYGPGEIEDEKDARKIADYLGIPFYVFDLAEQYNSQVLKPFCEEYLCGRTPNPCVICNHKMKFGLLAQKASEAGIKFDYFATGHYARNEYDPRRKRWILKKGIDEKKDQSYFLYHLSQEQLSRTLFPLGSYRKEKVRELAREFGLEVARKKESQDFISGSDYSVLFEGNYEPGPILDESGKQLGVHKGIIFYTIGQRKGLGISSREPLYVSRIDPKRNAIIVSPMKSLLSRGLIAEQLNWIAVSKPEKPLRVKAKIRQQHSPADATLTLIEDDKVKLEFDHPQSAITPGQAVVFYQDDEVLGGGTIQAGIR